MRLAILLTIVACSRTPVRTTNPEPLSAMPPGFDKAYQAWREFALRKLGAPEKELIIGPNDLSIAQNFPQRVGDVLWAFVATHRTKREVRVFGWANADGTVITADQNLGLLFEAAGVWTGAPTLDEGQLSERIVWAWGGTWRPDIVEAVAVDAQGAGVWHWEVERTYDGSGEAPPEMWHVTVTLKPDHTATLTKVKR